jgi:hypothetical protein
MIAKINVTAFATMIGASFTNSPYTSHIKTPLVNKLYITKDIPSVFFSLIVAAGMKGWFK